MSNVQPRGNKFQLRVKHRLLPKPFFATFDSHEEADTYGTQLEAMLANGRIPPELAAGVGVRDIFLATVIESYKQTAPITDSDASLLDVVLVETRALRVSEVTFRWVEAYIKLLKLGKNLSPGTIRKRIGVLARILDWHSNRTTAPGITAAANPLRMLAVGYSQYSRADALALGKGKTAKADTRRDFRVPLADQERVLRALGGEKREGRERALRVDGDLQMLFKLIIDTGLRLSEAYRLRVEQLDLAKGIIRVEGSKGARGVLKPRVVPLKRVLRGELEVYAAGKEGLLFPFWDGEKGSQKQVRGRLTNRFRTLFDYAGLEHLVEHDLRHEACCRWIELKRPDGVGWVFSDTEICRIMGWTSTTMLLRYASLRGEDLADRLL